MAKKKHGKAVRLPVRIVQVEGGLTFYEHGVIDLLRRSEAAFRALDGLGPDDAREFSTFVRVLERHVMSRVAQRGIEAVERA